MILSNGHVADEDLLVEAKYENQNERNQYQKSSQNLNISFMLSPQYSFNVTFVV